MTTQYWLVKSEPDAYSWETFLKDRRTSWDGVRNFQARNHLKGMKVGDAVFFYASVTGKAVLGVAEVSKAAYPDPTADEGEWVSVELKAKRTLSRPISLAEIKATPSLSKIALLRQGRLSVVSVSEAEFEQILKLSESAPPAAK